jgi:hypothetical protein
MRGSARSLAKARSETPEVVQVDLPGADCGRDRSRDLRRIDLQPDVERDLRTDAAPDASERFALDRLVELERAAPNVWSPNVS